MSTDYQNFFNAALVRFQEVDSVSGKITNEDGTGLGPRFNATSCSGCHAFPAVGGSSPANNPQIAMAVADGATNKIPRFITANGPVREARFIRNPNGTPDGGVHDLFVITGRSDAQGCSITQPDFEIGNRAEQHHFPNSDTAVRRRTGREHHRYGDSHQCRESTQSSSRHFRTSEP